MVRFNKKGIAILYTIISILLSIMLITTGISAVNKFFKSSIDNSERLNDFSGSINTILNSDVSNQSFFFELGTQELFMFFSAGDDPIKLKRRDSSEYLKFDRPDNDICKNSACICYCNEGPYWSQIEDEPFIQKHLLKLRSHYTCKDPICKSVSYEAVLFTNSRGYSDFTKKVKELVELYNDDQTFTESYFPIPMDIPLLLQMEDVNYKDNIFFSNSPGDDYNREQQEDQYVEPLQEFSWEGGVVIGGMGYAKDSSDEDDHILSGPKINLVFQKPLEDSNIIGVCLEVDKCITSDHLAKLKGEMNIQEDKNSILIAVNELGIYLEKTFNPCINKEGIGVQQAKKCSVDLQLKLETLFKQEKDGLDISVQFKGSESSLSSSMKILLKENKGGSSSSQTFDFDLDTSVFRLSEGDKTSSASMNPIVSFEGNDKGFALAGKSGLYYNLGVIELEGGKFTVAFRSLADES